MLDWRMVGASFAALVVVSSIFAGSASGAGSGVTDILSNIINQIQDWFKSSPLEGVLGGATPHTKQIHTTVYIYPDSITIEPVQPLEFSFQDISFQNFEGEINANFADNELSFNVKDSDLQLNASTGSLVLEDLEIMSLQVTESKFSIEPNMTADNGTLNMKGFSGMAFLGTDHIKLEGNFTSLEAQIGELTWDLT